jgi:hypothetical protein
MKFTSIKEKFLNWGEKTTIHALPIVFESRHLIVKIVSFFAFVVMFAACAYFIISNFITFMTFGVDTVLVVTRESTTMFPTVSLCLVQVCNLQGYSYQPYFNMAWNQTMANNVSNGTISAFTDATKKNFLMYFNKSVLLSATGNDVDPFSKAANFSIADYLISCQYGGVSCYESDWVFFQVSAILHLYRLLNLKKKNADLFTI